MVSNERRPVRKAVQATLSMIPSSVVAVGSGPAIGQDCTGGPPNGHRRVPPAKIWTRQREQGRTLDTATSRHRGPRGEEGGSRLGSSVSSAAARRDLRGRDPLLPGRWRHHPPGDGYRCSSVLLACCWCRGTWLAGVGKISLGWPGPEEVANMTRSAHSWVAYAEHCRPCLGGHRSSQPYRSGRGGSRAGGEQLPG